MKFTIKDVSTTTMLVEYEDGTSLHIPTTSADKDYYARTIKNNKPVALKEVAVEDVPYKKGDSGTVGDDIVEPITAEQKFPWDVARNICYPNIEYRIAVMYPFAGAGDATRKAALDAHLEIVWAAFPEDDTLYTQGEINAKLAELKKDPKFIQVKR